MYTPSAICVLLYCEGKHETRDINPTEANVNGTEGESRATDSTEDENKGGFSFVKTAAAYTQIKRRDIVALSVRTIV